MKSTCSLALGLVGLLTMGALAEPFPAVGSWQLRHGTGEPLWVEVFADGRAHSDYPSNNPGRWIWKGEVLHLEWADGWADAIHKEGDHFKKAGYPPKADREQSSGALDESALGGCYSRRMVSVPSESAGTRRPPTG